MQIIRKTAKKLLIKPGEWWRRGWLYKLLISTVSVVVLMVLVMFGISRWYAYSQRNKPYEIGVSFIPEYAQSLGVDPQETFDALLGIGVKHFRLVSYWGDGEPSPGQYDFSSLDWQFKKAEAAGAKVDLTVGLRQPRWPECHPPSWVDTSKPESQWQPQLEAYMQKVVERYKNSPALESYQLENEYFLKGFGACNNWSRERLVSEYSLIKATDPRHPVIVGRSNNALGFPLGKPTPDEWSISVYKRVWDAAITHRYLEYPFPSWFYGFLAGTQELIWHKNMMIAELQAESWPPNQQNIADTSLQEQNKSFNAERFEKRFEYAKGTGMRQFYLWGGEYWYYRKTVLHDDSVWNVAQQQFSKQP